MPETPSWEFLLQQDGDRAWLSIDPPTVEILEGRYRIAAKSTCKNVAVEVLIRHDATEEDPPKRRIQKRLDRTNQKGLMVVIPYTELQPGRWEFRCTPQADSAESEGQTHSIQFQVLPREADTLEDWNFDWGDSIDEEFDSLSPPEETPSVPASTLEAVETPSVPTPILEVVETPLIATPIPETFPIETSSTLAQETTPLAGKSIDEILQLATQQSDQLAAEVLHEYGLTSDDEVPSEVSHETAIDFDSLTTHSHEPELPPLSILLEQDTYIVQRGQTLDLSGELLSDPTREAPLILSQVELSICLRDPQTAEVLLETRKNLENQAVPSALTYRLKLPEAWNTQLVLGELILRDRTSETTPILASQSFTLTADVQDLLDAIRHRKAAEDRLDRSIAKKVLESTATSAKSPLNLTFLNFVQSPKTPQGENFTPVAGQILPPQLYSPDSPGAEKRSIHLPNLGDRPIESPLGIPTQLEIPLPKDFANPSPPPPQTEEPLASEIEQLEIELDRPATPDPFIDRLSTLAEDTTLSEELKAFADDVVDSGDLPEELVALLPPFTTMEIVPNPDPHEGEFVVDDEPILPVTDLVLSRQQKVAEAALERSGNPLFLPEDQPVPEPAILLAETELETGKPVQVRVQLPDVLPKIYVKLWINDRQNRSVLEPPRWIVDFTPNGLGNLEATTELRVPMGSVDVQIEAVTVEVMTNRESRKVSLDRRVLTSEPSSFSVEDFNG